MDILQEPLHTQSLTSHTQDLGCPSVSKVLKICTHIEIQLHITIRVKGQTLPLISN